MPSTLTEIINLITDLISLVIPIAVALVLLAFVWTIVQGFGKSDSVDRRAEVRQALLWTLIAIFVVLTLGGIVALFGATFPDLRPA